MLIQSVSWLSQMLHVNTLKPARILRARLLTHVKFLHLVLKQSRLQLKKKWNYSVPLAKRELEFLKQTDNISGFMEFTAQSLITALCRFFI